MQKLKEKDKRHFRRGVRKKIKKQRLRCNMARDNGRQQRNELPKNPTTIDEVKSYFENEVVLGKLGKSMHKEPKLFYQFTVVMDLFSYIVFASQTILERLPAVLNLRIDGTFKVVPAGPFKQLLIVCASRIYWHLGYKKIWEPIIRIPGNKLEPSFVLGNSFKVGNHWEMGNHFMLRSIHNSRRAPAADRAAVDQISGSR